MNIVSVISILLIAIFGLIAFGHICCLVRFLVKGTTFSVVPLVGGILGGVGFFLAPYATLRHFWWLPSILDYGSVPSLVSLSVALVRKQLQRMKHP
jgi:hypothetical protein